MSRLLRTGLNAGDSAPLAVVGGEGVYFHLADGRRLIDGSNTGGGLGHRHPAMIEAIKERRRFLVDILYGDVEGGQRTISRFGAIPVGDSAWLFWISRHWNIDREDPR